MRVCHHVLHGERVIRSLVPLVLPVAPVAVLQNEVMSVMSFLGDECLIPSASWTPPFGLPSGAKRPCFGTWTF